MQLSHLIAKSAAFGRRATCTASALMLMALSGCASFYVDTATKDVAASEYKRPEHPQPVQFVFEFQSSGAPNAAATKYLQDEVTKTVEASGLFAKLGDAPASGAAMLNLTLNNVPISKDAASKGFVTGLTFGLAGNVVTDGYICTVSYLPPGATQPVVATARHAIHTAIGNASAPPDAVKSENMDVAVKTMTRQIVENALRALSENPDFH